MELTPEKEIVNKYLAAMLAIGIESGSKTLREAVSPEATMVTFMDTLASRLNEISERALNFKLEFDGEKITLTDSSGASFKYDYPKVPALLGGQEQ